MPPGILSNFMTLFETVYPDFVNTYFNQALNKRLGTNGLTLAQISIEAAKKNITLDELIALPEKDGIVYEGIEPKDGLNYASAPYVVAVLKAAGVFG